MLKSTFTGSIQPPAPVAQAELDPSSSSRKVQFLVMVLDPKEDVPTVEKLTIEKSEASLLWSAVLEAHEKIQTSAGKPGRPPKYRCIVAGYAPDPESELCIVSELRPEVGQVCSIQEVADMFKYSGQPLTSKGVEYHMKQSGTFTKNGWTFLDFNKFLAKPDDALSNAHVKWCEENDCEPFK